MIIKTNNQIDNCYNQDLFVTNLVLIELFSSSLAK